MGTHPMPSVPPKSGAEGGRTSIPTSAATRPVAAAVTRQLDAASPRPVTNPGTMGRRCNPHLTCHMARAQAAAVAPLLDAASPHPVTNPGTMGGAAPVPEAPQHSFSDAASTAALLLSCCKYCSPPLLPHGSSRGAELQLLHCSLTQSAPVPLPIQGLWGGAASHCTRCTAGPRAAELSRADRRHRCGVPGLRVVAAGAKPRHHRGPAQEGQYTGVVGGQPHGCPQQQPPHGGSQGRRAVHSRPASQLRGSQAQADHTACQKKKTHAGHPAMGT